VNAPETGRQPRVLRSPEDFPHRTTETIRFGDLDSNNHVNNAVFSSFFEAGRVTLFRDPKRGLMPDGLIWTASARFSKFVIPRGNFCDELRKPKGH
jgi:hypothetical protein